MKVILKAKAPGKEILFEVGKMHVTVGRGDGVHVQVPDTNCSRAHCKFYVESEKVWVEDMASKNGTFVNGVRIQKTAFYFLDKVTLGDTEILISPEKNSPETISRLEFDGDTDARQRNTLKLQDSSEFTQARLNPLTAMHTFKSEDAKKGILELEASPLFKNSMPNPKMRVSAVKSRPPDWLIQLARLLDLGGIVVAFVLPILASQATKHKGQLDDGFMGLKRLTVVAGLSLFCSFVFWIINTKNSGGSLGERLIYVLWEKNQKKT